MSARARLRTLIRRSGHLRGVDTWIGAEAFAAWCLASLRGVGAPSLDPGPMPPAAAAYAATLPLVTEADALDALRLVGVRNWPELERTP